MVRPRQQQQMSQIKNCPNLSVKKWRYTNLLLCNWITGTLSEEALENVVGQNTTLKKCGVVLKKPIFRQLKKEKYS